MGTFDTKLTKRRDKANIETSGKILLIRLRNAIPLDAFSKILSTKSYFFVLINSMSVTKEAKSVAVHGKLFRHSSRASAAAKYTLGEHLEATILSVIRRSQ